MPPTHIRTAHTSDLTPAVLEAARALMDAAFEDEFGDLDWEHTLGGVHVLAWEGGILVAHGSVVQRRLLYNGRALRCGYVEGVAVHPDRQRRGLGSAVMDELERVIHGAYDLGALSTTDDGLQFYPQRGWQLWIGQTWALTPSGPARTEDDDGSVMVLPVSTPLDLTADLTCDWRDGDVW